MAQTFGSLYPAGRLRDTPGLRLAHLQPAGPFGGEPLMEDQSLSPLSQQQCLLNTLINNFFKYHNLSPFSQWRICFICSLPSLVKLTRQCPGSQSTLLVLQAHKAITHTNIHWTKTWGSKQHTLHSQLCSKNCTADTQALLNKLI